MEKVTVKIELDRDDFSVMMRLVGGKLTDEQWDKMKGQECAVSDDDLEEQAVALKLTFSALAFYKLLKDE